jgi:DNA processing protein
MNTGERRVVAALWSLQGIGPKSIEAIERVYPLEQLLELPTRKWLGAVELSAQQRAALEPIETLAPLADRLEAEARRLGQQVLFPTDPAWPSLLDGLEDLPRMLFMLGPGNAAPPRKRVGVVGTRNPERDALGRVRRLCQELVAAGLGVVSGAAIGIDQWAHLGALDGQGETWAFLGCAIDQMDSPQAAFLKPFAEGFGTFYSHYPPGTRSDISTFVRRNQLISGSSNALLVARAGQPSGALHTAAAALKQRRPLLVIPGDPWNPAAKGSNALFRKGAKVCLCAADVLEAVGLTVTDSGPPAPVGPLAPLSPLATEILAVLSRHSCDIDELQAKLGFSAGRLAAALLELEVEGYALQKGGGQWEKP